MIHDYYEILQLKPGPELHQYRFLGLDQLSGSGLEADIRNYCCVYSGSLEPGMDPETLYYRFNMQRPEDFYGHSMSVSDVVVLHKGSSTEAWYCDRVGFRLLPDFVPKTANDEEINGPLKTDLRTGRGRAADRRTAAGSGRKPAASAGRSR